MGEFRTWHRKEDLGWNTGAGLTELVFPNTIQNKSGENKRHIMS